jgi:predicted TPR repeat methyltransferase
MQSVEMTEILISGRENHRAGRLRDAEVAYHTVRKTQPHNAQAAIALGLVLSELGCNVEAIEVFGQVVIEHPNLAIGWVHLARAIAAEGFAWEAHDAISRAMKHKPDTEALLASSSVLMTLGNHAGAEKACRRALKMSPENATLWIQLGQILADDERRIPAAAAYQRALNIDPKNPTATFFLAALTAEGDGGSSAPPAMPQEYIRRFFDECAPRFDNLLVGTLQYQAPRLLEQMFGRWIAQAGSERAKPLTILDAGCGTGLCGQWLARHRGRLIGIDLSHKMIALSRTLRVYDELVAGDVVKELQKHSGALDLVVAGDVLVYIGDLTQMFAAVASALRKGGVFLFSVEAAADPGYVLLPTKRFAHSRGYVQRIASANGLAIRVIEEETLRLEKGAEVRGYLVLAEKAHDASDR